MIDRLCRKHLIRAACTHVSSTRYEKKWMTLITTILDRVDYRKNICLFNEYPTVILFGLPHVVKDLQQEFESINTKFENPVTITKSQVS
jgi:hypothetical protein